MLRKSQVNSSAGCVNFGQNARFLQKFPVFPCFFMILAVLIMSWAQVFHNQKVKDYLHRQNKKRALWRDFYRV